MLLTTSTLTRLFSYPGILWFAPFVLVPAAMFPTLSTTIIPEKLNMLSILSGKTQKFFSYYLPDLHIIGHL